MSRTSRSKEYDEAVLEAAESLAAHWHRQDAGDGSTLEYKRAAHKAQDAADEFREPFRKVWENVKAKAFELYGES